jgi:hypothetical protein
MSQQASLNVTLATKWGFAMNSRRTVLQAARIALFSLATAFSLTVSVGAYPAMTDLQKRIVSEQQYMRNCDLLAHDDPNASYNAWPVMYFPRQGPDAFVPPRDAYNVLHALTAQNQLTHQAALDEFNNDVKLTVQAIGYCQNRPAVQAQLDKDLYAERGTTPDITGDWYREGDRNLVDSISPGVNGQLVFSNENTPREAAYGHFTSPTTVIVDWSLHPTDTGTLSNNNNLIHWDDGANWLRNPTH